MALGEAALLAGQEKAQRNEGACGRCGARAANRVPRQRYSWSTRSRLRRCSHGAPGARYPRPDHSADSRNAGSRRKLLGEADQSSVSSDSCALPVPLKRPPVVPGDASVAFAASPQNTSAACACRRKSPADIPIARMLPAGAYARASWCAVSLWRCSPTSCCRPVTLDLLAMQHRSRSTQHDVTEPRAAHP